MAYHVDSLPHGNDISKLGLTMGKKCLKSSVILWMIFYTSSG